MISESTIDKVRELPIETIVGQYVKLAKDGRTSMKGLCPFHSENTPSFSINLNKNLYHCFGCNRGGDGISFIMEKENLNFQQAVRLLAEKFNILMEDEYDEERTDADKAKQAHKDSLYAVLEKVQTFFTDHLRVAANDDSRHAREYAYNRWPENFCAEAGIGYAPRESHAFMDYCRQQALNEKFLIELGMLRKNEEGKLYPMFRERIMIPIRNKWGRIIAYTARYIGAHPKAPKYINSITSLLYTKGETLFGIDRAFRLRDAANFIIVEGAPDVLRLQSIGLENTVATLGTAWNENQFEILKHYTSSLCFIPDTDLAKGSPYGPGFKAVMENGALAIQKGFNVTVRELPFGLRELTEEELQEKYEGTIPKDAQREVLVKNDADSYILDMDIYRNLKEKYFIVWMAEKLFAQVDSLAEEGQCVSRIAGLLRYVKDQMVYARCIEQLGKIHGKTRLWRSAVEQVRNESKKNSRTPTMDRKQEETDALRQVGLFVRNNCYFCMGKDDEDPIRLSNFVMEPLFHIHDESNGVRLFRLTNSFRETCMVELKESDLVSIANFQQKIGSCGNFLWLGKIEKLNNVKEFLYARTRTAERIRKLGWNESKEFFAFGNGIVQDGEFHEVDDMGIITDNQNNAYYIPATSKIYRDNTEIFQFERLMVHTNKSGALLYDYVEKLTTVFGNNARVAFGYLLATLFRDIVYRKTRHFPILNLFGEKGTGKTTLATSLEAFFLHDAEPPNMGVASVPAMNDRVSQAVNILVVFDEYKNDLDIRKIAFLKGLWGGGGQTKKNTQTDGMATQTIVTTGVVICGQEKPTQDMALYTRVLFLEYSKTTFSVLEKKNYEELQAICNLGLTHLTLEILKYRDLFEKNFSTLYGITKNELAIRMEDEQIHDRIFGNWVIPLAAFRTLETVLNLPFNYTQMLETCISGMRNQNELAKESSEVADFWNMLQGWQSIGKCVEKVHFNIRYLTKFRPMLTNMDIEFKEAHPILYLNMAAISSLFSSRNSTQNITANRSSWSTILSYLKSHPAFLGLKQDRFHIMLLNGTPDYIIEEKDGKVFRRIRANRPKAMCFDYLQLKEMFGLDLETEAIAEDSEESE